MDKDYFEESTGNSRKKKKSGVVLAVIGSLLVFTLAMFLGFTLYSWIVEGNSGQEPIVEVVNVQGEKLDEGEEKPVVDRVTIPTPGEIFTRQEVDAMVAQAREEASVAAREAVIAEIQVNMENGKSVVESLRACFLERIVLASDGKYYFVPIRTDLKKNKYKAENLEILENGELQYVEKEKVTSHKGIDVSKFQGDIDWEKVAADGVEFAIIRVGYRGYGGSGKLVEDENFDANIEGAKKAGLKTGVYFYSQAINEEELLEETQLILDKIAPYDIKGPIVFDVEKVTGAEGRMNKLSVEERTKLTKLFCETISKAGYKPMIYHNLEVGILMLNLKELEKYDKWFAYYKNELYYPYAYDIWQYSEKGKVDGIKTDVDLNIAFTLWKE